MDIETFGGKCPLCSSPMLIKKDLGHSQNCILEFDACPTCAFIEFDLPAPLLSNTRIELAAYVWSQIIEHHGVNTFAELKQCADLFQPDQNETGKFEYDNDSKASLELYRSDELLKIDLRKPSELLVIGRAMREAVSKGSELHVERKLYVDTATGVDGLSTISTIAREVTADLPTSMGNKEYTAKIKSLLSEEFPDCCLEAEPKKQVSE
ncbi:hypothetical protein VCHA53O466_50142 [Vibrio chagasii]|nr:hypothetical protein VCHA53O466_50142 [Vibrio chagasii]